MVATLEKELNSLIQEHGHTIMYPVGFIIERYSEITPESVSEFPAVFRCFFNNVRFNLQGGHYRKIADQLGLMDSLFESPHVKLHSLKKLEQTYRDFFTTIDETVEKCGLDNDKIKELLQKTTNTEDLKRTEYIDELYSYVVPLYIKLRDLEYTHYDLVQ